MSQTTRIVLVAIPTVLTFVTLITLILAYSGVTGNNQVSQTFWYLRVDTSNLDGLADYYSIGIWNYCSGSFRRSTLDPSFCSQTSTLWFPNVANLFSDSGSEIQEHIEQGYLADFASSYNSLRKLSHFNFIAFIISTVYSFLTIPVAIYAFRRQVGAKVAIVFSLVTMLFALGAAIGTTVLYSLMSTYFNNDLGSLGVSAQVGTGAFVVTWIGAGSAIASFIFWASSACCCAGRVGGLMDRDYKKAHSKNSSVASWNGFPTQPSNPVAYQPDQMDYYQQRTGMTRGPEMRSEVMQPLSPRRGSVYGARGDAHMPHDDYSDEESGVTAPLTPQYAQGQLPDTIMEESEPDSDHYQESNRYSHHFFEVRMSAPPAERQSDYNGRGSSYYSAGAGASRVLRSGTVFNAPTSAPTPPPKDNGPSSSSLHPLLRP